MTIVEEIAQVLYMADAQPATWAHALPEEKDHCFRLAEVIVDAVVNHLDERDENFGGALHIASALLTTEADLARLQKERR